MIKVIAFFILFNASVCIAGASQTVHVEAALVVQELVRISHVHLIPLHVEGLEDVPAQCRITNAEVEKLIRDYAKDYKGGKTPAHIALALNDLMRTIVAIMDVAGDNDGTLSEREKVRWKFVIGSNNSLFLVWCLYVAYLDVDTTKK